jgi:hypothetical protein
MPLGTPYVTPQMLLNAPSGVSWSIIPNPQATTQEQLAEATNMCWRATSKIDTYCTQVLRSTADTEYLNGPGQPRCNVDRDTGNGVLIMRRWPVTDVLAIQTSPATAFPRVWSPVPAGQWDIRHPLIYSGDSAAATAPDGGWTIDVAPGYITWQACGRNGGRGGLRVQVSYLNGWPHTSLTAAAVQGAQTFDVDDVTGWAGASGFCYDGASTEPLAVQSVTATTPLTLPNGAGTVAAGPGTVTLASPLAYAHAEGVVVSALPAVVIEAAVYAAAAQALEAGIDSMTIQTVSGERLSSGSSLKEISTEYELLLDPFRRTI